jgi:uncharacterized integral membrane protein
MQAADRIGILATWSMLANPANDQRWRDWAVIYSLGFMIGTHKMHYVTGTFAAIALISIAVFSFQNLGAVEVSFLVWSVNISKCIVIIGAYVLGMVSGWGLIELIKKTLAK